MLNLDVTRLTERYSRRALRRPNAAYFLWRFVGNGMRTARALMKRRAHRQTDAIARVLVAQGIVAGPSERFLTPDGRQALTQASEEILEASRSEAVQAAIAGQHVANRKKNYLVDLVSHPDGISAADPLLRLALDEQLLEIVSAYLGLWPCLHSVGAWLNYPTNAPPELSQLWHRDPGDLKLVKVFIYLNDVDEQRGPFTYIPGTHPFGHRNADAHRLEHKKRVADEHMIRLFPRESWRVCTGPQRTMILADTVGYHRGGKPNIGQRVVITFTYTSGTPVTRRTLWLREMPKWVSPIQRYAVASLLERPPSDSKTPTKSVGTRRRIA